MKSLYLVLDMENDLVHPDGPSGKSPMGAQVVSRKLLPLTAAAIAKARAAGLMIGFVRVGFSADYKELTIKVRPGITWSDGVAFTADDVTFTLNACKEYGSRFTVLCLSEGTTGAKTIGSRNGLPSANITTVASTA